MEWDFKTVGITLFVVLTLFLIQRSAVMVAAKSSQKIASAFNNNQYKLLPYINPLKRDVRNIEVHLKP